MSAIDGIRPNSQTPKAPTQGDGATVANGMLGARWGVATPLGLSQPHLTPQQAPNPPPDSAKATTASPNASSDPDWPVKFAMSRSHSNVSADMSRQQRQNVSEGNTMNPQTHPAQPSFANYTGMTNDPSLTSPEHLLHIQQQQMQQQMLQMQQQMQQMMMSPLQQQRGLSANPPQNPMDVSEVPHQHHNNTTVFEGMGGFMSPNGNVGRGGEGYAGVNAAAKVSPQTKPQQQQPVPPVAASSAGSRAAPSRVPSSRLMTLDPRRFTVEDINELLKVIEVSNQYGKEIERSVEELATLLQKKTIECEGLRKLAAENHSSLAEAVKNEYNSRVRVETKQSNEIHDLQNKIASMRSEKDDLQREVETLRMMVAQLKATPASLTDREVHANSLFNRLAKGIDKKPTAEDHMLSTWNLPRPSQLTPTQRDLVNFVGNISSDVARSLQAAGSFDFLTVLCQRLCTPVNDKGDVYPEMGATIGELLRELRLDVANGAVAISGNPADNFLSAVNGQRLSIAQQAASATIPLVKKSARMRVIDLFLANNPQDYTQPNKVTELNKLLEDNEGKEEELYERLLAEYRKKDPSGSFLNRLPPNNYVYQPPQTPQNATVPVPSASFKPAAFNGSDDIGTAAESELHVRVALMYKKYNPNKLQTKEYKELVAKYPPETLLRALIQRYGPEPTPAERRQLVRIISENTE